MKSVLIIEDNSDNMDVLEGFLEDDFTLLKATNGEDGLSMVLNIKPDIVLLDISLPKMDGTLVISKIREDKQVAHIPVIALTAHAMVGDREKFLSYGFNDYMSKPIVDDQLLIDMINNYIGE